MARFPKAPKLIRPPTDDEKAQKQIDKFEEAITRELVSQTGPIYSNVKSRSVTDEHGNTRNELYVTEGTVEKIYDRGEHVANKVRIRDVEHTVALTQVIIEVPPPVENTDNLPVRRVIVDYDNMSSHGSDILDAKTLDLLGYGELDINKARYTIDGRFIDPSTYTEFYEIVPSKTIYAGNIQKSKYHREVPIRKVVFNYGQLSADGHAVHDVETGEHIGWGRDIVFGKVCAQYRLDGVRLMDAYRMDYWEFVQGYFNTVTGKVVYAETENGSQIELKK